MTRSAPELREQLVLHKSDVLKLVRPDEEGDRIKGAIEQAVSWNDLSALCKRIDEAYCEGRLNDNDVETLTAHVTQKSHELPEPEPQQPLSSLLAENPTRRVRSNVLGEDVLWAADDAEIPEDNTLVVYRERELKEIAGRSPEELQAIHRSKRGLDMELMESGDEEGERIDAETLLAHARDDSCYACGNSRWWTKANGQRICGICHPKPRVKPGVSA